jgi:hypothetical protein
MIKFIQIILTYKNFESGGRYENLGGNPESIWGLQ